jgi:23S rRNA (uracil1939-C5)-methyltransferase
MLTAGDTLSLTIDKPAAGGRMIARVNGQIVLVSGAIPGERLVVRVERVGKGVAYAGPVEIEEASADRRTPLADPLCGGCLYNHIAYPRQLEIKRDVIADAFKRIGRLTIPGTVSLTGSPQEGYRMRARLHVRDHRFGFFREGSHEVCDARLTRQLLAETCDALDRVATVLKGLSADGVREIEIAENLDASNRVIALDVTAPLTADALAQLGGVTGFSGVVTPFGGRGDPHVSDRLSLNAGASVVLRRHVHAFFQGNRHLLASLVEHVVERTAPGHEVVDLYAGVGLFSVAVAATHGVPVTAVEGDHHAAADLTANIQSAGTSAVAVHQSVEQFVAQARPSADLSSGTVIVDPPRTGMSREALDGLLGLRAARVTYVSCDVATLARDARRLVDAGYVIDRVDGFDLFPNTPHVETVVGFTRN